MNVRPPVGYTASRITATATYPKAEALGGFLINTTTTGTIAITDGATTIMAATGALSVAVPTFVPIPATLSGTGLTFTLTGTCDITVFWL